MVESPAVHSEPSDPRERTVLVVFSDDWGRHPSSCQHLVGRLLGKYDVLWVNTIGTRPPRLDGHTLRRGAGKLRHWLLNSSSTVDRATSETAGQVEPEIISPLMWPWYASRLDRSLNRRLLARAVNRALRGRPRRRIAVTTIPLMANLVGQLHVDAWLYYCVDDLSSWPALARQPLVMMEEQLLQQVDAVAAVSGYIQRRLASLGREATLITHGVDVARWSVAAATDAPPLELAGAPAPRVVFWGLIDERLEASWVLQLADQLSSGSLILAGPIESVAPAIRRHPRIYLPGPLPFDRLPALARSASLLVMPYRDLPVTQAMEPLKLREYLATGLPCVVRSLPATQAWSDCLDLADSDERFVSLSLSRLHEGLPASQRLARRRLDDESWDAKALSFDRILSSLAAAT